MKKLKVAIIGQGRSGRDIHGNFFKSENNDIFDVVAVVDYDQRRRERALKEYPGCVVYEDYTELFARDDLDLVVNSSFSHQHYAISKDLLVHKFNVLVEKPCARSYYECLDLIKTAKDNGVVFAVFQQSLLTPFFVETQEILKTGKLGEIKQISVRYNGFARRWDWQTLQNYMGGGIYNTGPHPIGCALGLLDFDPETRVVYSKLDRCLTSGDSDDYAKIIMTAPGKPVVDIEVSSVDAFSDWSYKFIGSKGTYQCTLGEYKMKYIVDGDNAPQPLQVPYLQDEEGLPLYCSEKLITREETGKFVGTAFTIAVERFYRMLHAHMTEGTPMIVTPEMGAQTIQIIEAVHAQNPLSVEY